ISSIVLIAVGLWMRLSITETPEFQKAVEGEERVKVPLFEIFRSHKRSLFLGTFVAMVTFVLFYIGTAYLLSYNITVRHIPFLDALAIQIVSAVSFGLFIPLSGKLSERFGRRAMLIATTILIGAFSFLLPVLMGGSETGILLFAVIAMALMGMTYAPIGTALAAPFPTSVRYTGASMTFNLAGIVGASLAPSIALWLQKHYGLAYVGYYMLAAAIITLICILASRKGEV
ncbi:MAG TPA: MFS transporter, partial [Asticcacaulis sp.]|nr:MFS transporter [Asticcacaulis sp.]